MGCFREICVTISLVVPPSIESLLLGKPDVSEVHMCLDLEHGLGTKACVRVPRQNLFHEAGVLKCLIAPEMPRSCEGLHDIRAIIKQNAISIEETACVCTCEELGRL